MGKIIQIVTANNDDGVTLYALCDDGAVWEFYRKTGWVEIPLPVPAPDNYV